MVRLEGIPAMKIAFKGEVSVFERGALGGKLTIAGRSVFFELLKRPSRDKPVEASKTGLGIALPLVGTVGVRWATTKPSPSILVPPKATPKPAASKVTS
jgi:hypothetical protein